MEQHGIARPEWEQRFRARIAEVAVLTSDELQPVFDAEIQSWPEEEPDGWCYISPEDAADENMSYWTGD